MLHRIPHGSDCWLPLRGRQLTAHADGRSNMGRQVCWGTQRIVVIVAGGAAWQLLSMESFPIRNLRNFHDCLAPVSANVRFDASGGQPNSCQRGTTTVSIFCKEELKVILVLNVLENSACRPMSWTIIGEEYAQ